MPLCHAIFVCKSRIKSIVCGEGKGYSKKESQQLAAKDTLARLRRQEGLLQEVLDEKAKRTAMEEYFTASLPNISNGRPNPPKENPLRAPRREGTILKKL